MAMDTGPLLTEVEMQRQRQLSDSRVQEGRVRWWSRLGRKLFNLVRSLLIFALGATIVFLLISHRKEIAQKFNGALSAVQKKNAASPLRKSALDYEHEVDNVTK